MFTIEYLMLIWIELSIKIDCSYIIYRSNMVLMCQERITWPNGCWSKHMADCILLSRHLDLRIYEFLISFNTFMVKLMKMFEC